MSDRLRLVSFALVLIVALALGYAIGAAFGPLDAGAAAHVLNGGVLA